MGWEFQHTHRGGLVREKMRWPKCGRDSGMVWPRGLALFLDHRQRLPWKARPFPGPPPAPPLKGSVPAGDPPEHGGRAASTSEQDVLHKLRQVFGHLSMPANHHHEFPHETLLLRDVLLTGESSPPKHPVMQSGGRIRLQEPLAPDPLVARSPRDSLSREARDASSIT